MVLQLRDRPVDNTIKLQPIKIRFSFVFLGVMAALDNSMLAELLTLDNGTIKVGVDTLYGGGITYLSQSASTTNLINIYDFGREVQQSYYSGPANFVPPGAVQNPQWSPWPWNPIQVGDSFGYRAAVLAYSNSGGTIYVRTRPTQWALRNYPGDCIMEQWTRLDGPAVRVHCKLTNQRTDRMQYPAYGQELPAVYGAGSLCHIFSYTGTAPFTGGALTQLPNAPPPNWTSWRATENWSAMVDGSNFGFGVHNPDSVFTGGGYSSSGNPCTGGPTDNNTTYISPQHIEVLDWNIVYEYDFNLIVGTLTTIRNWAYTHSSDHLPDYHFGNNRQHWYSTYGDSGVPSGFLRENLNGPDPSLIGPNTAFAASACPRIYFAARYVMSSPPADPTADLFWETNNSGGFSETRKQSVTVIPDGTWRVYSFDVGANPAWSGLISQLRLDPIQSGGPGDYVDIAGISYQNAFPELAFFMGEVSLGNGVYYLQFPNGTPFGYYSYLTDRRFIYHFDMGFEYWFDANDGLNGIYFYDFASNHFFYTSPSTFPYLYDFSLNAWLYYLPDVNNPGRYTHNPRWFYNFATGQWITL
jgi:hypothetical protein